MSHTGSTRSGGHGGRTLPSGPSPAVHAGDGSGNTSGLVAVLRLPIEPVAKGRARASRAGNHIRMYTPQKTAVFERQVALLAATSMPRGIIDYAVRVDILAVLRRPKRLMHRSDPDGLVWAPKRPDIDNLRKSVMDGLAPFWRDDALVVSGTTLKVYAEKTGRSRMVVTIYRAGDVGACVAGMEERWS